MRLISAGSIVLLIALGSSWRLLTKLVPGRNVGIAVISAAGYVMMARAPVPSIRERAAIRDEDASRLSILHTCAAVANLVAVAVQLGNLQPGQLAYGMITFRRIVNMHTVLSFLLQCVGAGAYRECLP